MNNVESVRKFISTYSNCIRKKYSWKMCAIHWVRNSIPLVLCAFKTARKVLGWTLFKCVIFYFYVIENMKKSINISRKY
jgi:hypothetical protein